MGKPIICICETKGTDQLRSNCEADQHLCFRYMDRTIPLLSKSNISSFWPSSVLVQAGLCRTWSDTTLLVFPRGGSFLHCFFQMKIFTEITLNRNPPPPGAKPHSICISLMLLPHLFVTKTLLPYCRSKNYLANMHCFCMRQLQEFNRTSKNIVVQSCEIWITAILRAFCHANGVIISNDCCLKYFFLMSGKYGNK